MTLSRALNGRNSSTSASRDRNVIRMAVVIAPALTPTRPAQFSLILHQFARLNFVHRNGPAGTIALARTSFGNTYFQPRRVVCTRISTTSLLWDPGRVAPPWLGR